MMLNPIPTNTNLNFGRKYCWIPKCKARCCSSAPLPKHYLEHLSIRSKAKRSIYAAIPAPPNNPYCNDALIAVTKKPLSKTFLFSKEVFIYSIVFTVLRSRERAPYAHQPWQTYRLQLRQTRCQN